VKLENKYYAKCILFNGEVFESEPFSTIEEAENSAANIALKYLHALKLNIKVEEKERTESEGSDDTILTQKIKVMNVSDELDGTITSNSFPPEATISSSCESSFSNGVGWDIFFSTVDLPRSDSVLERKSVLNSTKVPVLSPPIESIPSSSNCIVSKINSSVGTTKDVKAIKDNIVPNDSTDVVNRKKIEEFTLVRGLNNAGDRKSINSSTEAEETREDLMVLQRSQNYVGDLNSFAMKNNITAEYNFSSLPDAFNGGFECVCILPFGKYRGAGVKKKDAKMTAARLAMEDIKKGIFQGQVLSQSSKATVGRGIMNKGLFLHPKVILKETVFEIDSRFNIQYEKICGPPINAMWKVKLLLPLKYGVVYGNGLKVKAAETECAIMALEKLRLEKLRAHNENEKIK
jgi:hypothetical protein